MSPSGHSSSCAAAVVTTPAECECRCDGGLHGGHHSERARAFLLDPPRRPKNASGSVTSAKRLVRRSRAGDKAAFHRACTDFIGYYLVSWVIDTESVERQDEVLKALTTVVKPFVSSISTEALSFSEAKRLERAINENHLLCGLCVEVLKLHDEIEKLADEIAQSVSEEIVHQITPALPRAVESVLTRALATTIKKVVPTVSTEPAVNNLRIAGVIFCPNIADHLDVTEYCLEPLGKTWAGEYLARWIKAGFPDTTLLLKRRGSDRP